MNAFLSLCQPGRYVGIAISMLAVLAAYDQPQAETLMRQKAFENDKINIPKYAGWSFTCSFTTYKSESDWNYNVISDAKYWEFLLRANKPGLFTLFVRFERGERHPPG